eukprot:CFRG2272T1
MNDPLFQIDNSKVGSSSNAQKRRGGSNQSQNKRKRDESDEDVINSDNESGDERGVNGFDVEDEEEIQDIESAAEKRVRLAKEYLTQLKDAERAERSGSDDDDVDADAIGDRLRKDHNEKSNAKDILIAHTRTHTITESMIKRVKGHNLSVTCTSVSGDEKYLYTVSKDCNIIKWNIGDGKRLGTIKGLRKGAPESMHGHRQHILAVAVSDDGKYLATGGLEENVEVWDAHTLTHIKSLNGHRDAVMALVFRRNTHTLFSGSLDRTVKIWDLDEMCYIETLFGHQDGITALASLNRERCVSVGGRDRTCRMWKIVEESQLVFNGHHGNTETICMINENIWCTGAEDGSINVWHVFKKKPACTITQAHTPGMHQPKHLNSTDSSDDEDEQPKRPQHQQGGKKQSRPGPFMPAKPYTSNSNETNTSQGIVQVTPWVTALASMPFTDLVASGSNTGVVKLWCLGEDKKLTCINEIEVEGFINSLTFSKSGRYLVAGVGQEHRLGRWERIQTARNSAVIIDLEIDELLPSDSDEEGDESSDE